MRKIIIIMVLVCMGFNTKVYAVSGYTYNDGYIKAYGYWYKQAMSDFKKNQYKSYKATWTDYNQNYSNGYRDGFNKAIKDAGEDFKDFEYDRGIEDGKRDAHYGDSGGDLLGNKSDDYIRGYQKGNAEEFTALKKKQKEDLENALASVEIPENFQNKPEIFTEAYRTGFYDSKKGFNYDEEQEFDKYTSSTDQQQYIQGYRNGWNDQGGSLPFFTKIELIYLNHQMPILITMIIAFLCVVLLVRFRKKAVLLLRQSKQFFKGLGEFLMNKKLKYFLFGCVASTAIAYCFQFIGNYSSGKGNTNTDGIIVTDSSLDVYPGDEASITIHTKPGAEGSIEVDYKSGPSTAQGLEPQTAGSDGDITWTWMVGTNTSPGDWNVEITVDDETIEKILTVE